MRQGFLREVNLQITLVLMCDMYFDLFFARFPHLLKVEIKVVSW